MIFHRQYYTYITDKRCKRLGSQAWVFVCITLSELILNIKFGLDLFSHTQMSKMILWLTLTLFISSLGMFISMKIYKWRYSAKGDRNNEKFSNASEPDSPSRNTRSKGNVVYCRKLNNKPIFLPVFKVKISS